jgi:precorrin-2/cobalt-factor-2 C20-methyltransferase
MDGALGTLIGVGVGPGDPDLVTLKAARILGEAQILAYFVRRGGRGRALASAEPHLRPGAERLALVYPVTTEIPVSDPSYGVEMSAFYDRAAGEVGERLAAGRDVVLICEGDPFFYGSFMHLFHRLEGRFPCRAVPGVTGMSGCWTDAMLPMTYGDDVMAVIPASLPEASIVGALERADAAVLMKLGGNFAKAKRALALAGRLESAVYVANGTHPTAEVMRLAAVHGADVPYFSLILVPGRGRRA